MRKRSRGVEVELELGDEAVILPWYVPDCVRGGLDAPGIRLRST